jgi:hypothetical protein
MTLASTALTLSLLATASPGEPDGPVLRFSVFPGAVGGGFSTSDSTFRVFRNAADFLANWPRNSECDDRCASSVIAPIDFSRDMLVILAPRGSGQETYDVVVTAVTASSVSIDVGFLELRHGEPRGGVLCGVILTVPQPAVAITVAQSDQPVRFFRRRADVICEQATQVQ